MVRTFLRQDCSSVESEKRWLTISEVAESVDAWDCARDGTKHQISSQDVECVAKVDYYYGPIRFVSEMKGNFFGKMQLRNYLMF